MGAKRKAADPRQLNLDDHRLAREQAKLARQRVHELFDAPAKPAAPRTPTELPTGERTTKTVRGTPRRAVPLNDEAKAAPEEDELTSGQENAFDAGGFRREPKPPKEKGEPKVGRLGRGKWG